MIVEAFLTYEAHDYLANQTKIPENIFAYIYNRFKKGQNVNEMIEYLVRPLGIMRRRVLLEDKWWKNGDGPLLAVIKESGDMCALIPGKISGYTYFDR